MRLRALTIAIALAMLAVLMPARAAASAPVSEVSTGHQFACLLVGGSVSCWGANDHGQLGQGNIGGSSLVPVQISGLSDVVHISVNTYDACALRNDETAWCWGDNSSGQLGSNFSGAASATPVQLTLNSVSTWSDVAAGQFQTCGLETDLVHLVCGTDPGRSLTGSHTFPSAVAGDAGGHRLIGVGSYEACATLADTTVWCLGDNGFGPPAAPAQVSSYNALDVSAGYLNFACAVLTDGSARCWDDNGGSSGFNQPGVSGASVLDAQQEHVCALVSGGDVSCWDYPSTLASAVPGLSGASAVAAMTTGGCVLLNGGVECWGTDNSLGQLGDGTTTPSSTPVAVSVFGPPRALPLQITVAGGNSSHINGVVATVVDPNGKGAVSDYSATIEWGDGTSGAGTVTDPPNALYVSGTHTYGASGNYTITVSMTKNGFPSASSTASGVDAVSAVPVPSTGVAPPGAADRWLGFTLLALGSAVLVGARRRRRRGERG